MSKIQVEIESMHNKIEALKTEQSKLYKQKFKEENSVHTKKAMNFLKSTIAILREAGCAVFVVGQARYYTQYTVYFHLDGNHVIEKPSATDYSSVSFYPVTKDKDNHNKEQYYKFEYVQRVQENRGSGSYKHCGSRTILMQLWYTLSSDNLEEVEEALLRFLEEKTRVSDSMFSLHSAGAYITDLDGNKK